MKIILTIAVVTGMMISIGSAQEIKERQKEQQERIAQGVASGQLTPKETVKLEKKEARINREVRRDRRSGGHLSANERAKIAKDQNKMSAEIYRQKHDAQTQPK
jgi:hypothetical protein